MPKPVLYGELKEGKRDRGACKAYKDQLKQHLLQGGLYPIDFETSAADKSAWRLSTRRATIQFEANRISADA